MELHVKKWVHSTQIQLNVRPFQVSSNHKKSGILRTFSIPKIEELVEKLQPSIRDIAYLKLNNKILMTKKPLGEC